MNAKIMVLTVIDQVDYIQLVPDLMDEQIFWGVGHCNLNWIEALTAISSILKSM